MLKNEWIAQSKILVSALVFVTALPLTWTQNYANRDPLHAGIEVFEDDYNDDLTTDDYDWNMLEPQVWRWNVEEYPNPMVNPRFCNRMKSSYVCDPDQILTRKQVDDLDMTIQNTLKNSPCICDVCGVRPEIEGVHVGIALLRNAFQPYNEHPSKIIRSFTENLRAKWRLGACDNDILIVVATDDRQSYTDVGPATSRYISLRAAYEVFLENRAHFSSGHYYRGLKNMLLKYHEMTQMLPKGEEKPLVDIGFVTGLVVGIALVITGITIVIVIIAHRFKSRRTRKSGNDAGEDISSSWNHKGSFKNAFPSFFSSATTAPPTSHYQQCKTEEEEEEEKSPKGSDVPQDEELNLELPNTTQPIEVEVKIVHEGVESSEKRRPELKSASNQSPQKEERSKTYKGEMTDL